jgi:DNA-binding LacI/PurR family transcriptional regulator
MVKKKTSIYSIAEEAGVSVSTVSRALNGNTRIGSETIDRIRRIAHQVGYKLPPLEKRPGNHGKGRAMRELSLVFYTESWMAQELIEGINSALGQVSQRISVISNSNGTELEELLPGDKQPDGIIFLGYPEKLIASGILQQVPGVQVVGHRKIQEFSCDRVGYNHNTIAELAVEHLQGLGLRKLGFYFQENIYVAEMRWTLFRFNAEFRNCQAVSLGFSNGEAGYSQVPSDKLKAFFKGGDTPLGIFAYDNTLANYLNFQLLSLGLIPEKDFYIVTCVGNQNKMGMLSPIPGMIKIDFHKIGALGAKSLIRRIANPTAAYQTILTEPQLQA